MKEQRIVFATGNQNKMKEIKMILGDLNLSVISIKEAGIRLDVVEDGETYQDNALIKVRAAHKLLPDDIVMADDSGFEVDHLGKAPGVFSARYMGEDTSYVIKNGSLLEKMREVPDPERASRFVCAIATILPDGTELVRTASMEGKLAWESKGENGFGYDPILYLEEFGCTSAELTAEQKNAISHRGKALRETRTALKVYLSQEG